MNKKQTKLLIIGSGPAGYSAAIYAVRAGLKPILVSGFQKGGQITTAQEIENYPGFPNSINGQDLMNNMHEQSMNLGVEIIEDTIDKVDFSKRPFVCKTEKGLTIEADVAIIATGARAKYLEIPSEKQFIGFGISTCSTCDSFFYRGKNVAVVGGGNKAAKEVLHLAKIAQSVTIIHRIDKLTAEKAAQEKIFANPNINFEWNSEVVEFIGNTNPTSLTKIKLKNKQTGTIKEINIDGVFLSIGNVPQTKIFEGQIDLTEDGYIKTHGKSTKTNINGVFAAGDVQEPKYQQVIIAAASGALATIEAEEFLDKMSQ